MKAITKNICKLVLLLFITSVNAQETIDAENPNNFVTGGGQESQSFTLTILPVSIIDIEGFSGFNPGINTQTLEAGLPVSGGTSDLSNIWLNYTFRGENGGGAEIFVSTNMPVPNGVRIEVQIDRNDYGNAGDFDKTAENKKIRLSESESRIVKDFGNGYTGDGQGNGYHVIYTISNPNGVSFPDGFEIIYRIGN
jgi:hypothetical protein